MVTKIDGLNYLDMMHGGIKNLEAHKIVLNDLNVFPVPDGDTGTNMAMTLKFGYEAARNEKSSLTDLSQAFSSAAVYGARGNSGVILSQFIKGISEEFKGHNEADPSLLSKALSNGCEFAYASVAKPVEGTMLTVVKDASQALSRSLPLETIDEAICIFLEEAKRSLQRTPELLPILKKAGVVDSGGSGIVYFFEGMSKYLKGEDIIDVDTHSDSKYVDLSSFNKNTSFDYGYCVEGLIQLRVDAVDFDLDGFKTDLTKLGNSIVASIENDKLKLHIHTKDLGSLMTFCQSCGEFLTIKIDNMTVQNAQNAKREQEERKFLYSDDPVDASFAVVAVATNSYMQQKFFDMGADVVIMSDIAPSSQDFIDAFKFTSAERILVFPNSSNSLLTAMQAGSMYKKAKVTVLNSRSPVECYVSLPLIDFEGEIDDAVDTVNNTVSELYQVSFYHATKDIKYGRRRIQHNEYFALSGNKILNIDTTLDEVVLRTIEQVLNKNDYSVITLFYGEDVSDDYIASLSKNINSLGFDVETALVSTHETIYCLCIAFE